MRRKATTPPRQHQRQHHTNTKATMHHANIDAACPGLTPAAREFVRSTVDKARRAASTVSLADFDDPFADESLDDPDTQEEHP